MALKAFFSCGIHLSRRPKEHSFQFVLIEKLNVQDSPHLLLSSQLLSSSIHRAPLLEAARWAGPGKSRGIALPDLIAFAYDTKYRL